MPRQERSFRTPALIIKRRNFGEADRLLTVLTPAHGKFNVIAKGARKPTSAKTGHVELFTQADMLVHRGRNLDIATQSVMVEGYLPLREELQRGAYANYVAELLDRFTIDDDTTDHGLYELLNETFARLCIDDDSRLVVRYFELRLLDNVGFRPELQECVFTHDPLSPQDQFFSYSEGGVVSPEAAKHAPSLVALSLNTLKLLRHMQRSGYHHVKTLSTPSTIHNELERIMLGYITYLLEKRLQSVDFIRKIRQ